MSSVDEHMQFAFQVQLPEAVAMIINPSSKRYDLYRLVYKHSGLEQTLGLKKMSKKTKVQCLLHPLWIIFPVF